MFTQLLLLMCIHHTLSYIYYNPTTHQILLRHTLSNITGYELVKPPKALARKNPLTNGESGSRNGQCREAGFKCKRPFSRAETFQFECEEDFQCPNSFKCCTQKCFMHKICSSIDDSYLRQEQSCGYWPFQCSVPYDYYHTSRFRCNSDQQCPTKYKCCYHNCFLHKVCLSGSTGNSKEGNNIEPLDRNVDKLEKIIQETTENVEIDTVNPVAIGRRIYFFTTAATTTATTPTSTTTTTTTTVADDTEKHINITADEYEAYYYHYGGGNDTKDSNDYDYEEEEEDY